MHPHQKPDHKRETNKPTRTRVAQVSDQSKINPETRVNRDSRETKMSPKWRPQSFLVEGERIELSPDRAPQRPRQNLPNSSQYAKREGRGGTCVITRGRQCAFLLLEESALHAPMCILSQERAHCTVNEPAGPCASSNWRVHWANHGFLRHGGNP